MDAVDADEQALQDEIIDMSKMMKLINEKQLIRNAKKIGLNDSSFETVLVVKVHNNIKHLGVLLDSIRKIRYITKSLLIFAHDYYNFDINFMLRRVPYVRTMQIFYPYSSQIYPDIYPGRDDRFCRRMNRCVLSNRRNATLAQSKLFWWWVTSQVFDHIDALKEYEGYIYFLESELYLSCDFIHVMKMMEKLQPLFCPQCRLLSLASRPPRPEQYSSNNNSLVVDAWGPNFSSSVTGFHRQTWHEIKYRKQAFCYLNDSSWGNSLRYLFSTTHEQKLLVLSTEGPRAFSTKGCGEFRNRTGCSMDRVVLDISNFLSKIQRELFPEYFELKVGDTGTNETMQGYGNWEDARDKEFCMYIAIRNS
ncbi:alpha-1,6-mannosyl-glycoprotein 2-beta-N-acetylglucosaminyltransferase-like [Leguminivora glycinivorella]|uniref:alpha-1,6-mannosyl-glycoprotein 2-beta-N-acetylglucosaminyltransferase-like n=1 Tax=Leguminivora glycinivorella TaxID=1035111 RepID=UPI00200D0E18|nr:alpha-1,6-mannosyl-glycoprotein 2-beta-N-acetylglucosaminyltransferase-like [Leguminivora glycinivorella]